MRPRAFVLAVVLAGCATTAPEKPAPIPDTLAAPLGQRLVLKARAVGYQIYECRASADPAKHEWTFKAPQADLYDAGGTRIATHYAGPTWESLDGSKVVGEVTARDDGPDAGAIPWLLLASKSNSGTGLFGSVKSIQRVYTVGGKAPAEVCDEAHAGQLARVPYRATYNFYGT